MNATNRHGNKLKWADMCSKEGQFISSRADFGLLHFSIWRYYKGEFTKDFKTVYVLDLAGGASVLGRKKFSSLSKAKDYAPKMFEKFFEKESRRLKKELGELRRTAEKTFPTLKG